MVEVAELILEVAVEVLVTVLRIFQITPLEMVVLVFV
jgi:hypothetical protein